MSISYKYYYFFIHLKLDIALAIPASIEWKIPINNSAVQGLGSATYLMVYYNYYDLYSDVYWRSEVNSISNDNPWWDVDIHCFQNILHIRHVNITQKVISKITTSTLC